MPPKHGPEARKKIGKASMARWRDPAYRARCLPLLLAAQPKGNPASQAGKFQPPPRGTPEYRAYRKVFDILGREAAHAQFKSAETDRAGTP